MCRMVFWELPSCYQCPARRRYANPIQESQYIDHGFHSLQIIDNNKSAFLAQVLYDLLFQICIGAGFWVLHVKLFSNCNKELPQPQNRSKLVKPDHFTPNLACIDANSGASKPERQEQCRMISRSRARCNFRVPAPSYPSRPWLELPTPCMVTYATASVQLLPALAFVRIKRCAEIEELRKCAPAWRGGALAQLPFRVQLGRLALLIAPR